MTTEYVETRMVLLGDLTPFPGNARHGDRKVLRDSLEANGQYRSLVVRQTGEDTLIVLAGNNTLAALEERGDLEARCEIIQCDDATALRVNLVDNASNDKATYDDEARARLLMLLDGGLTGSGYGEDEADAIIARFEEDMSGVTADDVPGTLGDTRTDADTPRMPDVPENPVTTLGDVWILGPHRIMCGDCLDPKDSERLLEGIVPDLVYADPPYGIRAVPKDGGISRGGYGPGRSKGSQGAVRIQAHKFDPVINDDTTDTARDSFQKLFGLYPESRHVWWGANHYASSAKVPDASCWLVWDKVNGGSDFADCELAWTSHRGAVRMLRHQWSGMFRATERDRPRVHPTQKPVALAVWAFGVVDKGRVCRTVYDPFTGSGSTLLACEREGRKGFGMEISPRYVDVVCKRYQQVTGTVPVLERTGEQHDFGPVN